MPLHIHRTAVEPKGSCQESFKIFSHNIEWTAHQDRNVEQTRYYNCDKSGVITEIDYSGWRLNGKYKYEGRPDQFEFTIKFLETAKPKLDKFIQALKSRFPKNKLLHLKDPFKCDTPGRIGLNLWITEDEIEGQTLLENIFRMITATDPSTVNVVSDIKDTISSDCLHWFKVMLSPYGYFKSVTAADLKQAAKSKLHHNSLQDVSSPFYLAAEYVQKTDPEFAMELLEEIPLFHWQYSEAQSLKEEITQKLLVKEKGVGEKIEREKNESERNANKNADKEEGVHEVSKEVLFLASKRDKNEGLDSSGSILNCSGSIKGEKSDTEGERATEDSPKLSGKLIQVHRRFS